MSIVAILQARASSSRLPNKVLKPILGTPMLQHQLERVNRSKLIDHLVVATSVESSDDELAKLLGQLDVNVYRGSLDDVLDRFYHAAVELQPTHVVRLTGDCPLMDPAVIDDVIAHHLETGADYTSNVSPPSFPDGLDVEVMTYSTLEKAWKAASLASDREHVTSYIRKKESGFAVQNLENEKDLSALRWTVDELDDFNFVTEIYAHLYRDNPEFNTKDILNLLVVKPELGNINQGYERNEGYFKSLLKDNH